MLGYAFDWFSPGNSLALFSFDFLTTRSTLSEITAEDLNFLVLGGLFCCRVGYLKAGRFTATEGFSVLGVKS